MRHILVVDDGLQVCQVRAPSVSTSWCLEEIATDASFEPRRMGVECRPLRIGAVVSGILRRRHASPLE